jgi:DNA (cytosine-5)-methyltransferase 1
MILVVRERLCASGISYVIENVVGAPLEDPLMLCGSVFGLDVRRHRIFETSFAAAPPSRCDHSRWEARFPQATNRTNRRKTVEVGVWRIPLDVQRAAMGIDWMSVGKLSQAIPPAHAEHLARQSGVVA